MSGFFPPRGSCWLIKNDPLSCRDLATHGLSVPLCAAGLVHHIGHLTWYSSQQHTASAAEPEQWTIVHWAKEAFSSDALNNVPSLKELDTILQIELFPVNRLSFSDHDHDSSERVSRLMDRGDLCGMCFCDTHISHNFHSQWDKVSEGCTLTCISEPEPEMHNRRQIRQLPSDKLTSRNRNGPGRIQCNCHTRLLKGYFYFQPEHASFSNQLMCISSMPKTQSVKRAEIRQIPWRLLNLLVHRSSTI